MAYVRRHRQTSPDQRAAAPQPGAALLLKQPEQQLVTCCTRPWADPNFHIYVWPPDIWQRSDSVSC